MTDMSKRLLVTDDAIILREIIKDTAQGAGYEIVGEASNGQQAAEKYDELLPDVMTLDLVMPDYDGLHALRSIRAKHPHAKIIMVSALDQKAVLKDAFKLGAFDFVVKPFDRKQLIETLDRAIATTSA
jgi:two-component system, chemotaxis family, chemotaxis protein CheY